MNLASKIRNASVVAALGILLMPSSVLAATISSTFDADSEGWFVQDILGGAGPWDRVQTFPVQHSSTGGNPGGYIFSIDPSANFFRFAAPSKFLGNKSALLRGTLSVDLAHSTGGPVFALVILRGGAQDEILAYQPGGSLSTSFLRFNIPLDADGSSWLHFDDGHLNQRIATTHDFESVLSNLTDIWIQGDTSDGSETTRLDNFSIVPELATAACIASGEILRISVNPGNLASSFYVRRSTPGSVSFLFGTTDSKIIGTALKAQARHMRVTVTGSATACGAVVGSSSAGGTVTRITPAP